MSPGEVRRLARLAALDLPPEQGTLLGDAEVLELAREMSAILGHVRALSALDLAGVEPTSHGMPLPTALRDDVAGERLARAKALAAAPQPVDDGFAVPKVVE